VDSDIEEFKVLYKPEDETSSDGTVVNYQKMVLRFYVNEEYALKCSPDIYKILLNPAYVKNVLNIDNTGEIYFKGLAKVRDGEKEIRPGMVINVAELSNSPAIDKYVERIVVESMSVKVKSKDDDGKQFEEVVDIRSKKAEDEVDTTYCMLRFYINDKYNVKIPEGVKVATDDGTFTFESQKIRTIKPGPAVIKYPWKDEFGVEALTPDEEKIIKVTKGWVDENLQFIDDTIEPYVSVDSLADKKGAAANDYGEGRVNVLKTHENILTFLDEKEPVSNSAVSDGGFDLEDDISFRKRVNKGLNSWSNAGAAGNYELLVRSAHPDITEVAVKNIGPGKLEIYTLTRDGLPTPGVINLIKDKISGLTSAPYTDYVDVKIPDPLNFGIEVDITLLRGYDISAVEAGVKAELERYAVEIKSVLGRDIVRNQIVARVNTVQGVYGCEVRILEKQHRVYVVKPWEKIEELEEEMGKPYYRYVHKEEYRPSEEAATKLVIDKSRWAVCSDIKVMTIDVEEG